MATTLISVQLYNGHEASENYCGCHAEEVVPEDRDRVRDELATANAGLCLYDGKVMRAFWTDPDEAERAAERAERLTGCVAVLDERVV